MYDQAYNVESTSSVASPPPRSGDRGDGLTPHYFNDWDRLELPALRDDAVQPMSSKGGLLPPEMWENIARNANTAHYWYDEMSLTRKNMGSFALVCRWWALKWRPLMFATVTLKCARDVQDLAEFLPFETPHIPSMGKYIKKLVVQQTLDPDRKEWQPWLHTVHILLHRSLLHRGSTLTLHVQFDTHNVNPMPVYMDSPSVPVSSHKLLPQALPMLRPHCQDLTISEMHFHSPLDISRLLSKVRVSRSLTLRYMKWSWDAAKTYKPAPVTIYHLRVFRKVDDDIWNGHFRFIAARKIGDTIHEMAEHDINNVINFLSQLGVGNCTYVVEEATSREGHACKLSIKLVFGVEWGD